MRHDSSMRENSDEQKPVGEAGVTTDGVASEEAPYSIYTQREKWLIVAMVAMAGFYRYVPPPCAHEVQIDNV